MSCCRGDLPFFAPLAGSTIVANVRREPSGLHAGETIAALELAAISVTRRASPSIRSSVQRLNQRDPRCRARWNAMRSASFAGDQLGNSPKPIIFFSLFVRLTVHN